MIRRPANRTRPMSRHTDQPPLVFYHAGLGKVASTYLQKRVFPALEGIHYIPRDRFRGHRRIIQRAEHDRYLLSRECGKYLDRRLKEIASIYPDARILLFFRRHDQWIASHYRRYVKNGGYRDIRGYIDIAGDEGIWKRDQLLYMDMLDRVEQYFGRKPFVLTYDRLVADGDDFNRRLAKYLGGSIDPARISRKPVHTSYAQTRLVKLRVINRRLQLPDPEAVDRSARPAHRLKRRLSLYRSYLLLLATSLFPDGSAGEKDALIPSDALEDIRSYYAEDWQALCRFEASQFEQ